MRSDHRWKIAIVYLLAIAALVWVFYDIEWTVFLQQVQRLSWRWVLLIIGVDALSFCVQGLRWQILLRPLGRLSALKATQAIYVGLFSSEVLPLRAGEIIRGLLVGRWLERRFREVVPSMALERLFDGIWFSGAMILTALLIDVPPQIRFGTNVMLGISAVGMGVFVWVVRRTHVAEQMPEPEAAETSFLKRMNFALYEVRLGLKQIGTGGHFWSAFGVSGLLHLVQAIAFLAVLEACAIDLPLLPMIAVFLVVQLGIAIPNAPANVGTFQLFTVLALTFFGLEKSTAAAFSLVAFTILTIPVLLIGVAATLHAGLSLTGFRTQLTETDVAEGAA